MKSKIFIFLIVLATVLFGNLVVAEELNLGFQDEKISVEGENNIVNNICSNWISILIIILLIFSLVLFLLKQMN